MQYVNRRPDGRDQRLILTSHRQGKTDVAMLTILRVLNQHRSRSESEPLPVSIRKDDFKVIYV